MAEQTARELIAEADRHKRAADMADWARTKIRLWERPEQRRGLLRFKRDRPEDRECVFDAGETAAIYEALAIVKRDHLDAARRLEERVTTTDQAS